MDFYEKLLSTAELAGLKTMSDDDCCQLLAWLYVLGGQYEAVTLTPKLNAEIKLAQNRLGLSGGSIPNIALYALLKGYLREVEPIVQGKGRVYPKWCHAINQRYRLPSLKNENK